MWSRREEERSYVGSLLYISVQDWYPGKHEFILDKVGLYTIFPLVMRLITQPKNCILCSTNIKQMFNVKIHFICNTCIS